MIAATLDPVSMDTRPVILRFAETLTAQGYTPAEQRQLFDGLPDDLREAVWRDLREHVERQLFEEGER